MAKDPLKAKLSNLQKELARKQASLLKLQERLRGDPNDAKLREKVQAAKRELIPLIDQDAETQREISRAAGGRQFTVEL
jgi:hypothetical protein